MAKPPPPPAFNPDGTPKGHRATVSGHSSAGEYAVEPNQPLDKHRLKPTATPISPDVDVLHSKHTTPEQETPTKHKPESGKLKDGVESRARLGTAPDVAMIQSDATGFSPNVGILIGVFAGIIGLLAIVYLLWYFVF
ncbi:MAG: hypothetical protein AAF743_16070 [Planctomycetota bacterium]